MATLAYSDDHYDASGLVASTRVFDDGTVEEYADGKTTTRPATPDEQARAATYIATPEPTPEERIAVLEADLAEAKAQAEKAAAIEKALVTKAILTAKDITDAAVAVEPVGEVKPS